MLGEEPAEPRAAGEDERLSRPAPPRPVHHVEQPPSRRPPRSHGRHAVPPAEVLERLDDGLTAEARHERPALGFVQGPGQALTRDLRPACLELLGRDALERHAFRRQRLCRAGLVAVFPGREPERAGGQHEGHAPGLAVGQPRLACAARPARVEAVRAVRGADDARLVAARGPRVPGAERVKQRDRPAAAGPGVVRRPGAHRAGAHHEQVAAARQFADRFRPRVGDAHRARRSVHGVKVRICVVAASTAAFVNGSGTVLPAR